MPPLLLQSPAELVLRAQQPFNYCVIDEVDSILIDEARTPLIISGTSDKPSDKYYKAAKIADALTKDLHYTVDEKQRNVLLTEDGYEAVEDVLQVREGWTHVCMHAFLRNVWQGWWCTTAGGLWHAVCM
jgi:preprotein translocase subunit SecA